MALQQPTRQTMQQLARSTVGDQEVSEPPTRNSREQQPEQSQTWVLFSPPTETTTASYLTETEPEHSLGTPGRSRLSDLGSLHTVARTASASAVEHVDETHSVVFSAVIDESVGDDAELDSLDGHLPGFRSLPRSSQHAMPVLPTHDGLGSFHLDQPTLSLQAQDQIYQFERFNPRRVRRRLNSFEQPQFELDHEEVQESEKRQRIEAWRLEHSRTLLEEIQRETRRRMSSKAPPQQRVQQSEVVEPDNMSWHEQEAVADEEETDESEGLLARITRKVLQELLDIDDRLLSILLGEELPSEEELSRTPRASQSDDEPHLSESDESWQIHILERVSRELGLLVNQLSKHPGAFSTYSRVQQMPLPYAGLPVIPESADGRVVSENTTPEQPGESTFPEFKPTIHPAPRAVTIPSQKSNQSDATVQGDLPMGNTFTQEEWEKDMDIKLVFKYLVSRFTSQSDVTLSIDTPRHNPAKAQDTAAKAARIKQHHPLISRSRPTERRVFKATAPSSPVALRHHSSCASQSTRRSARRSSVSSKHYWDIGGSIGTGSMIASNGPMGSWGEI